MKAKINYPENASRAKAILIAGLVLIQVTLFAGENTGSYTLEEATESELELEDWMSNVNSGFWLDLKDAQEPELAIESWMYNTQDSFWLDLDAAEDSEPALESWMYDIQNIFWLDLDNAEESEPAIESWMTNPNDWINSSDDLMLTSN